MSTNIFASRWQVRLAMDNHRSTHADFRPLTAPRGDIEFGCVLPCCISGAGMRFKIGPSNHLDGYRQGELNDTKHQRNDDGSNNCEPATSWAIVSSASSTRKEIIGFIIPKRRMSATAHASVLYTSCLERTLITSIEC